MVSVSVCSTRSSAEECETRDIVKLSDLLHFLIVKTWAAHLTAAAGAFRSAEWSADSDLYWKAATGQTLQSFSQGQSVIKIYNKYITNRYRWT